MGANAIRLRLSGISVDDESRGHVGQLHIDGQPVEGTFSNDFLAHLQVATAARFHAGKGYFLTTTAPDDERTEVTRSHWLHPTIPVRFVFDVRDDSGNRVAPVTLDHTQIDALAESMDQPNGVRADAAVWWPFHEAI
jgi:hypothetical protein